MSDDQLRPYRVDVYAEETPLGPPYTARAAEATLRRALDRFEATAAATHAEFRLHGEMYAVALRAEGRTAKVRPTCPATEPILTTAARDLTHALAAGAVAYFGGPLWHLANGEVT